jgi:hypothetical protein
LPEEAVLDFRIDLVEPLLRALGLLPVCFNLGLKLSNAILGSPEAGVKAFACSATSAALFRSWRIVRPALSS